jgi:transposase
MQSAFVTNDETRYAKIHVYAGGVEIWIALLRARMPQAPAASALALRDPLGVITQVRFATTYGQSSCAFSVGCVIISFEIRRALFDDNPSTLNSRR